MIPILLPTHSFHRFGFFDSNLEKVMKFAKNEGFDGVELTETLTTRWQGPKWLRDVGAHYEMPIQVVHQSIGRMVLATLGSIERVAKRTRDMGAKTAVVHLGAIKRSFENERVFRAVREIEKKYDVHVALENAMAQVGFLRPRARSLAHEPDGFAKTLAFFGLSATYDVGHMSQLMTDLVGYAERIRENLRHIHLHNVWGRVDHQSLAEGDLPIRDFLRHLTATKFSGTVTLEIFPYNTRPFMARKRAEQILRENLAFARKYLAA